MSKDWKETVSEQRQERQREKKTGKGKGEQKKEQQQPTRSSKAHHFDTAANKARISLQPQVLEVGLICQDGQSPLDFASGLPISFCMLDGLDEVEIRSSSTKVETWCLVSY